eukprot:95823_1
MHANTIIPCIIALLITVIICVNYQNISYDSYNNFINERWPHHDYSWKFPDKQSNATAIFCVWAVVLLIFKICEGIVVTISPYYTHQPPYKSYIISASVLVVYIIMLLADLQSDLLATVILGIFMNQFIGIEQFCSILWIYNFKTSEYFLCLTMKCWLRLFTFFFSIFTPITMITLSATTEIGDLYMLFSEYDLSSFCYQVIVYTSLLIMFWVPIAFGMGLKHTCCSMQQWYTIMTYYNIMAIWIVYFGIIANWWDEWLCIGLFNEKYCYFFMFIFLWYAPIFNLILFTLLALFAKSLPDLLKHEYPDKIINTKVLRSIQNKLQRNILYILLVLIILVQYLWRFQIFLAARAVGKKDVPTSTDFISNVTILSSLSLIIWFESPSVHFYFGTMAYIFSSETHLKCNTCQTPYLTKYKHWYIEYLKYKQHNIPYLKHASGHCEICGDAFKRSEKSKSDSDEVKIELLSASKSSIKLQPIESHDAIKMIKCNTYDISQCEAVNRILKLSSQTVFDQLEHIYDDWTNVSVLNDYIHVVTTHKIQEINEITDDCKCNEYINRRRRRNINFDINQEYIIKLTIEIHSYLYHNTQKQSEQLSTDKLSENYHDDRSINQYGFGSFIYYNLLKSKYKCFKTEMLTHIDIDQWNSIYEAATYLLRVNEARNHVEISVNNHNNVLKEQYIQFGDILSIKFYTDLDEAQRKFRQSFRKLNGEDDKAVIKRHVNEYYFWGKWLHHAIEVYGHKIDNEIHSYFHGLDQKFKFPSLRNDFNIPTSVTTDVRVAQTFAGVSGIILQIKCQWNSESQWNRSKALPVTWISKYKYEQEVLLFGIFNQLMIANIIDDKVDDLNDTKLIVETINNFERLCKGIELNRNYDDSMHALKMKKLIENEITNSYVANNDYFADMFHNICLNLTAFSVKALIHYHQKRSDVLQILNDQVKFNNINICCNGCKVQMIRIDNHRKTNLKCASCDAFAIWDCRKQQCESGYKLCGCCSDMVQMISMVLKNAQHVIKINEYDTAKMNALRIESLMEKKLL